MPTASEIPIPESVLCTLPEQQLGHSGGIKVAKATRCSPATVTGKRSLSLASRRNRVRRANERSTTQRLALKTSRSG